jgi:predicted ester cyclase
MTNQKRPLYGYRGNETIFDQLPGGEGNNRFKHFHKLICSAFSDINFTVETAASQGNRLTAEWSGTMVHTGVFQDRAPTGKRVSVRGTYEGTVVDGKIANGKNTWNYADILRQIDF